MITVCCPRCKGHLEREDNEFHCLQCQTTMDLTPLRRCKRGWYMEIDRLRVVSLAQRIGLNNTAQLFGISTSLPSLWAKKYRQALENKLAVKPEKKITIPDDNAAPKTVTEESFAPLLTIRIEL